MQKLSRLQDLAITMHASISFNARIKMANSLRAAGFPIFPSKRLFYENKKKIASRIEILLVEDKFLICSNSKALIEERMAAIGG